MIWGMDEQQPMSLKAFLWRIAALIAIVVLTEFVLLPLMSEEVESALAKAVYVAGVLVCSLLLLKRITSARRARTFKPPTPTPNDTP